MTVFKYNQAKEGAPKIGFSGGVGLPPGQYILKSEKIKPDESKDKKNGNNGKPMIVTEWTILKVIRRDFDIDKGYKSWDNQVLTANEGDRRSYVIKSWHAGWLGDLNELAVLMRGIDSKSPLAMRNAKLVQTEESAVEMERVADELNKLIAIMVDEKQPYLNTVIGCTVADKTSDKGHTFMRHTFDLVRDDEGRAHNSEVRKTAGLAD